MTNKEFAEKNAGKYFRFGKMRVRVVGYRGINGQILVSAAPGVRGFGWGAQVLDDYDVFVIRSKASKYWYVEEYELKKWE